MALFHASARIFSSTFIIKTIFPIRFSTIIRTRYSGIAFFFLFVLASRQAYTFKGLTRFIIRLINELNIFEFLPVIKILMLLTIELIIHYQQCASVIAGNIFLLPVRLDLLFVFSSQPIGILLENPLPKTPRIIGFPDYLTFRQSSFWQI